ncbi:Aerobic respiration control sensor protein ArcB [compost metagenome]
MQIQFFCQIAQSPDRGIRFFSPLDPCRHHVGHDKINNMLLPLFSVLLITLIGFGATLLLLLPQRRQSSVRVFFALQTIYFGWALASVLMLVATSPSTKTMMVYARFLIIPFAPPLWLILMSGLFKRAFYEKYRPFYFALFILPAFISLTALLNLLGFSPTWSSTLLYDFVPLTIWDNISTLGFKTGPLFNVYLAYSYILISLSYGLSVKTWLSGPKHLRKTAFLFACAGCIHIAIEILAIKHFPEFRWTQVTIASTLQIFVACYWVITRHDMFKLRALAKEKILDDLPLATITVSPLNQLWDFNQKAAELLSLSSRDLGLSLEALQKKLKINIDSPELHLNNRIFLVQKHVLPLQLDLAPAQIFSFSDVTDIQVLSGELSIQNQNLQDLNRELAHAIELNQKMFSVLSHDLSGSLASSNLVMEGLLSQTKKSGRTEIQSALELTLKSQKASLDLLADLLKWNLTNGGYLAQNTLRTPSECLDRVLAHLTAQSESKRISFLIENQFKNLHTSLDAHLFETILRNIISNAIRHSHEGGEIQVGLKQKGDGLRLEVLDRGNGISMETISRLNGQANFPAKSGEGFGVGLFFTRRFVKELGGAFNIVSENQKGTLVVVELPLRAKDLA